MLLGNDKHEEPLVLPQELVLENSPERLARLDLIWVTRECLPGEVLPEHGLINARLQRDCRA
jgi:hypothetical protein